MLEIDRIEDFKRWARDANAPPAAVQALDLRDHRELLCCMERRGSLFLACKLDDRTAGNLVLHGAIVVSDLNKAFTVHRAHLYAAEHLYKGYDPDRPETFEQTPDHRIYQEFLADGPHPDMLTSFARALHDHSISAALDELLKGERVVAIMGGHKLERSSARYAQIVRLAKALAERSYLLASGGGPGAMEATHLGAWLAGRPDAVVTEVLSGPFVRRPEGSKPNREYADPDWLARAWRVREAYPRINGWISVGIPTWLYGHEPPTPFATHLAKYFANSVREDGVLAIANHGVVFARGSAGTTQEIFQDACQNHYGTVGLRSPMVLLDSAYWTDQRPVWPLLRAVSEPEVYGDLVLLADRTDQVLRHIQRFEPSWYLVDPDPAVQFESDLRRLMQLRSNWVLSREQVPLGGEPIDWEGVIDWLYSIGGDDWINRERGARVLPARCEGLDLRRTEGGIGLAGAEQMTQWSAALND